MWSILFRLSMIGLLMCQSVLYTLAMTTINFFLQDERLCDIECGAQMKYVMLYDHIKVYGGRSKLHPSHMHGSCGPDLACELKLLPSTSSLKKQEFHLIFLEFEVDNSNDEFMLKLDQTSSDFYKDVSQIATLTRDSEIPHDYMSGVGNSVRFRLTHGNRTDNFGFIISVTRTGATFHPSKSDNTMALSPPVTIFLYVSSVIMLFFIVFLIIKMIKQRRNFLSSRRNNIALTDLTHSADRPSIVRHAHNEDESYVLTDFPYVNTPMVIVGNSDSPADSPADNPADSPEDSPEVPAKPPPAYEDVMQFSDE